MLQKQLTKKSLPSINNSATGSSYATTRIVNAGSRYDKIGGESALLASSLGGIVGREHISIPTLSSSLSASSTSSISDEQLSALKSTLSTKVENLSYECQMMDHLHSTAYQNGPAGNSLGNALDGSTEGIASISSSDVTSLLNGIVGADVVVVGTGSGNHDKLVEDASKAYGGLGADGSRKEGSSVGTEGFSPEAHSLPMAGDGKSAFIGSDVRYVLRVCCCWEGNYL